MALPDAKKGCGSWVHQNYLHWRFLAIWSMTLRHFKVDSISVSNSSFLCIKSIPSCPWSVLAICPASVHQIIRSKAIIWMVETIPFSLSILSPWIKWPKILGARIFVHHSSTSNQCIYLVRLVNHTKMRQVTWDNSFVTQSSILLLFMFCDQLFHY